MSVRPAGPLVELRGLGKTYGEGTSAVPVLRDIDLSIARGESVVLLGRSGSGKSTLLNLIAGLDLPSAGEVLVDGLRLTGLSETERTLWRRRHLGFVFQSFSLLPTLSVLENVLLPLVLNGTANRAEDRALRLLERLGLGRKAASYPEQLSGGEQQRVAIARALVHEPLLVLADEPTGNLDLETAREVLDLLDGLTREAGRTLVMATHSREVVGLADRILRLGEGRLWAEAGR